MATATTGKRKWWPFLLAPYVLGITWTCLHPTVSIVTGEFKCRGWFIDEKSLDPGSLQQWNKYFLVDPAAESATFSLCDSLSSLGDNMECIRHEDRLEVAKVVPISNAVAPVAEMIVVVVPACPTEGCIESKFHNVLLQLIKRLSDPSACPWLAKTILFVSPVGSDETLHSTVSLFLNAYLGEQYSSNSSSSSLLPTDFITGLIRALLVLDLDSTGELRILPQGRHGVLPNMDLVFTTTSIYQRRLDVPMRMHPYEEVSRKFKSHMESKLPRSLHTWACELLDMMLFSYSLVMGPHAPHYTALDRGIDALTIQGGSEAALLHNIGLFEVLLRAISNTHERLHHSITQYLLPSPSKFVSHAEFLLPSILILLPLLIRAASLILVDMEYFDTRLFYFVLTVACASLLLFFAASRVDMVCMNSLYIILYMSCCIFLPQKIQIKEKERKNAIQTLQFLTCLVAIYLHVPITLSHVSLAYPSALLWSPLIAFPAHPIQSKWLKWPVLATSLTLAFFVVNHVFHAYTPYATTVFLPLHLLVSLLWLL